MLLHSIRAEWTKLTTIKSFYWTSLLIVALSWLLAGVMGAGAKMTLESVKSGDGKANPNDVMLLTKDLALSGYQMFGLMVVIIMSALVITSEYRFGTIRTSIMMIPRRPVIVAGKVIVYGIVASILALISAVGSILISVAFAGKDASQGLTAFGDGMPRLYGATVVSTILIVMLSIGVGLLIRQTAGAVAILLLWKLVLEDILTLIPKIGDKISPYRPFANLNAWVSNTPVVDAPWGVNGSLVYFIAWVVVIFGAGLFVFSKRDA